MKKSDVVGLVLAGGQSRRMGEDKAAMLLVGRPLAAHVIAVLRQVLDEVWLVGGSPILAEQLRVPYTQDSLPGAGPLAGIYSGLLATRADVFVSACDTPLLQPRLLQGLLACDPRADVVVPVKGGEYEPLMALYRKACTGAAKKALASGARRIISMYGDLKVREVPECIWREWDEDGLSFMNVNSPGDLEAVRDILEGSPWKTPAGK